MQGVKFVSLIQVYLETDILPPDPFANVLRQWTNMEYTTSYFISYSSEIRNRYGQDNTELDLCEMGLWLRETPWYFTRDYYWNSRALDIARTRISCMEVITETGTVTACKPFKLRLTSFQKSSNCLEWLLY